MLELWRFRQLITLADTGNFRRAADKLGITHGALSQTIAKMEKECRAPLFERRRHATVPTAYGETLLRAARTAVQTVADAGREISLMRNLQTGQLNVGIDPVLSEGLLAPTLAALLLQSPTLRFTTLPHNWRTMEDALASDQIDLFVGLAPDRQTDRLEYKTFNLVPPVFACRSGHAALKGETLTIDDLVTYPFGGGEVPDWLLMQFINAFPDRFPSLDSLREVFLTTHDLGLMRQLLSSTDIIGLVPEAIIDADIRGGQISKLPKLEQLPTLDIMGVVVTREDRPTSPAAARLSSIVIEFANLGWRLHQELTAMNRSG